MQAASGITASSAPLMVCSFSPQTGQTRQPTGWRIFGLDEVSSRRSNMDANTQTWQIPSGSSAASNMRPQPGGLSFLLLLLHLSPSSVFAFQQQQSGETIDAAHPLVTPRQLRQQLLSRSSSLLCLSTGARERCGNQSICLGPTTRGTLGVGGRGFLSFSPPARPCNHPPPGAGEE